MSENSQGNNQENNQENNSGNHKKGHPLLLTFFILLIVGLALYFIISCHLNNSQGGNLNGTGGSSSSNVPQLTSRSARNSDISIDVVDDFSLSNKYTLIANVDIKNLELKFTYYDKNRKILTTVNKSVGNVVKGGQYTVAVSLSEFSLMEVFKISYSQCEVIGGTVSYFA